MKEMKTAKQRVAEFDQGYNVSVTGRHVHVTDAMKAYAEEKLSKLERIGNRIIDVNVTMDIQKVEHKVDIVMKYGHTLIKSQGSSTDMYASIDKAVDKLQSQLRRYKRRLKDHHAKEYPVMQIPMVVYQMDATDEHDINAQIESENEKKLHETFFPHKIVRSETQSLKILTDDEAIMKIELSGASCIVYRSEQTRKLKVIYRLEDGNYGVVEPE